MMAARQEGQINNTSTGRGRCLCPICQAGYVPSQRYEFLWHASPVALESALMSMCRFCFRCRRPACPECWDEVHGVCGACTQEAGLPFRRMPAPLDGMGQPPYQQPQAQRVEVIPGPLICVSPGRFREDMSSGGNTGSEAPLSDPVVIPASQKAVDLHEPSDRGQAYTYGDASASGREPSQEKQSYEEEEDFLGEEKARSGIGIGALIERAVTAVLLVVLVVLVLVILLAWFSARANGLIFNILHIDIRDEIAYLLLLMKNLH